MFRFTYSFFRGKLKRPHFKRLSSVYSYSCSFSTRASDHFGRDYKECKSLFVERSKALCASHPTHRQYEIPMLKLRAHDINDATNIDTEKDLSVDITILNENNTNTDHLIMHISGIHGAEGYTGSSIQNCFLHSLLTQQSEQSKDSNDAQLAAPVIILVHGLNPYGFQLGRRFNENNVDLNRNLKTEEQWQKYLSDGLNIYGYVDFDALFNPEFKADVFVERPVWFQQIYKFWFRHSYWMRAILSMLRFGIPKLGSAATAGQCYKSDGLFYVGRQHELQHLKLTEFIRDAFRRNPSWKTQIRKVTVVDVHTGVGPKGIDSLYADKQSDFERIKELCPKHDRDNLIELLSDSTADGKAESDSLQGAFQFATGFSPNYRHVFHSELDADIDFVGIIQEFGTYHKMRVFQALRENNAVYQSYLRLIESGKYDANDPKLAELKKYVQETHDFVKHVFYINTDEWKSSIVEKGVNLMNLVIKR